MSYAKHIKACNQYAQSGPSECARMVKFVLATIQQRLETVPKIVEDYDQFAGDSMYAWGVKRIGLAYLFTHRDGLYRDAMVCRNNPSRLLEVFMQVPGLGLVKAGFAAQIFNNKVGCIDTHNIKLYDIPLSALKCDNKLLEETKAKKRANYIGLCNSLGGSEFLWGQWCEYVARLRPNNWADGEDVSQFHVDTICGTIGN